MKVAGTIIRGGYVGIKINGNVYRAHRLAWIYVYGYTPLCEIDHRDGDKTNNKISNLRDVTSSVNKQNRKSAKRNNKLGVLGVTFIKRTNKYRACIRVDGKQTHLGYFNDSESAYFAYLSAKRDMHIGCAI